jgi:CspA family cold shock protein
MATGIVKFFNETKGFGFIVPEDGGRDVFVHKTAIELAGLSALKKGQALSFEVIEDKKGQAYASELKFFGTADALRPSNDRHAGVIKAAPFRDHSSPSNDNRRDQSHAIKGAQPTARTKVVANTRPNEAQSWQYNYDKYIQYARHAEDLVTREGHWQHAEHYLRLLNGSANL